MIYTVYILYSQSYDKFYVGYTSNLIERFKSHNSLGTKGWTIKFRPWGVIYCEYFGTEHEAMKREKVLKTAKLRLWIRKKIENEYKKHRIHIRLRRTAVQICSSVLKDFLF